MAFSRLLPNALVVAAKLPKTEQSWQDLNITANEIVQENWRCASAVLLELLIHAFAHSILEGAFHRTDLLGNVGNIIEHCKTNMKTPPPLVIDADGLYLITQDLDLLKGYGAPVVLTPNVVEFLRLSSKMGESDPSKMAAALNAVLVCKGREDVIANGMLRGGPDELRCDVRGSDRRCGGQGDVLSGCAAAFVAWVQIRASGDKGNGARRPEDASMRYGWAAYGGCAMTRLCSRSAFEEKGRGMTTSDMIEHIHKVFKVHFEV